MSLISKAELLSDDNRMSLICQPQPEVTREQKADQQQ